MTQNVKNKGNTLFNEESHNDLQMWWITKYGTEESRHELLASLCFEKIKSEHINEDYFSPKSYNLVNNLCIDKFKEIVEKKYNYNYVETRVGYEPCKKGFTYENYLAVNLKENNSKLEVEKCVSLQYKGTIFLDIFCSKYTYEGMEIRTYKQHDWSETWDILGNVHIVNTIFPEFFVEIKKTKENLFNDIREIEYYKTFLHYSVLAIYSTPDELNEIEKKILLDKNIYYVQIK